MHAFPSAHPTTSSPAQATASQCTTSLYTFTHPSTPPTPSGYNLWSSHGRQLEHKRHEKLYQMLWRPRPPSLLPESKEKDIRKNLRDYSKK